MRIEVELYYSESQISTAWENYVDKNEPKADDYEGMPLNEIEGRVLVPQKDNFNNFGLAHDYEQMQIRFHKLTINELKEYL